MAYTKEQEARLQESTPISYESAVELGKELGYSTRSIIAKAKSLEITYIPKAVPTPKEAGPTKAELVASIEASTGLDLTGLAGATAAALTALNAYVSPEAPEAS